MMNGDAFELSQMMQTMERNLSNQLKEVATSVAGIKESVQGVKDTHSNFREELLGERGRVVMLEKADESAAHRQWIHTGVIVPVVAALHVLAAKMGWRV